MEVLSEAIRYQILLLSGLGSLCPQIRLDEFFEIQNHLVGGNSLEAVLRVFSFRHPVLTHVWVSDALVRARVEVDFALERQINIMYPGHSEYPLAFLEIPQPPLFISYVGNIEASRRPRLSIVGSREISPDTKRWFELYFDAFLKLIRAVTISGAARGVDQWAHKISLRNQLPTYAWLPSGVATIYPKDFKSLVPLVVDNGGAILSEFLPRQEMLRFHFERRNRLIAAHAPLLFVAEARRKSGSLITARFATEENNTICILPASPIQSQCLGTLDLLTDGAIPVKDHFDLAQAFSDANRRFASDLDQGGPQMHLQ